MALQDILDAMDANSRNVCAVIRQEAEEKAKAPMDRANEQYQSMRQKLFDESEARAESLQAKILADTRRTERKNTAMAIAAMVRQVIAEATRLLETARTDPRYPAFLEKLISEATMSIPDGIRLLVDPRDVDLAQDVAARLRSKISIHCEIDTTGGIVATSEDGRIVLRNTIETRLKEVERRRYSDLALLLSAPFTPMEPLQS